MSDFTKLVNQSKIYYSPKMKWYMADNQNPQSVNATGTVNVFEQEYCLTCETTVLKCNKCSNHDTCLNFVKKEMQKEIENENK